MWNGTIIWSLRKPQRCRRACCLAQLWLLLISYRDLLLDSSHCPSHAFTFFACKVEAQSICMCKFPSPKLSSHLIKRGWYLKASARMKISHTDLTLDKNFRLHSHWFRSVINCQSSEKARGLSVYAELGRDFLQFLQFKPQCDDLRTDSACTMRSKCLPMNRVLLIQAVIRVAVLRLICLILSSCCYQCEYLYSLPMDHRHRFTAGRRIQCSAQSSESLYTRGQPSETRQRLFGDIAPAYDEVTCPANICFILNSCYV